MISYRKNERLWEKIQILAFCLAELLLHPRSARNEMKLINGNVKPVESY